MTRPPTKPTRSTRLRYHLIGRGHMYQIASHAGMSPSVLSDYSLGRKAIPAHHLIALAEVLGVPEDDLIGDLDFGEQEMTPL